jgi:hypothetical protein
VGAHRSRERRKAIWHLYDSMLIFSAFFYIENLFSAKRGLTWENVKGVFWALDFMGDKKIDPHALY